MAEAVLVAHMIAEQIDGSPQNKAAVRETDFSVARAFILLLVMLVTPLYLALSVVMYSTGALL